MKIAVIHPKPANSFGGAEAVSAVFLNELADREHEVTYYSESTDDFEKYQKYFGYEISDEIKHIRVEQPLLSKLLDKTNRFTILSSILRRKKYARKTKKIEDEYDLILFSANTLPRNIELETPTIQYLHDHPLEPGSDNKIYNLVIQKLNSSGIYDADLNLFNSKYLKKQYDIDGEVLHPPVKNDFKFEENTEEKAIIVGRISRSKNIDEAIEIISRVGMKLVVAGFVQDANYYKELQKKEEKHEWLEIKSNLERQELVEEIETSKIGLNCRKDEPFGMNVVEYMYAGTIPLVWHEGGPSEIVDNEKFTYLNTEEAVEKIKQILDNNSKALEKIRLRSNEFSMAKFEQKFEERIMEFEDNL